MKLPQRDSYIIPQELLVQILAALGDEDAIVCQGYFGPKDSEVALSEINKLIQEHDSGKLDEARTNLTGSILAIRRMGETTIKEAIAAVMQGTTSTEPVGFGQAEYVAIHNLHKMI